MNLAILFALVVADGIVPPVPSEAVLLAHAPGAFAAGWPAVVGLWLLAATAAFLGDTITYSLGRLIGTDRFAWQRSRRVARLLDRTGTALERRGVPLIVSARLMPGWRVAITFLAGASRLSRPRFLLASALGSMLWSAYMVGIGATVGALTGAGPLVVAAVSLVTMAVLGQLVRWIRRAVRGTRRTTVDARATGHRSSGKDRLGGRQGVPEVRRGRVDQLVVTATGQHLQ